MKLDEGMMKIDPETGEILEDIDISDSSLQHYGMPRRSGRYPWGSGENPYQRTGDFISRYNDMKSKGMSNAEIAAEMGIFNRNGEPATTQLLTQLSVATNYRRAIRVEQAKDLKAKGFNNTEIGEKMGINESTVRSLLNTDSEARTMASFNTAKMLKEEVDKKGKIDVGLNVNRQLGVSQRTLDNALMILEAEGYPTYGGRVRQVTNKNNMTTLRVLCPPGTEHKDIYKFGEIHQVGDVTSHDGGETYDPAWVYPKSLDSKRVQVVYAEDGGLAKDGLIELRRGVEDISLGNDIYAQVRILVDGTHYIKGMAVYSDDLPEGVDIRFNTNKKRGTPMMSDDPDAKQVLKPISKDDPNNPFGSLIKDGIQDPDDPDNPNTKNGGQRYYYDENGVKQLSVINKRASAGDWNEWSDALPSQFLSKQNLKLVEQQLRLAKTDKQEEFEEISALTNPTVKRHLLTNFANDCDSAAVHLKAAALPRQRYQVIIPLTDIKDDEVYAPNFEPGEKVALIRYPHGGTFEIPILKVNNKNAEGRRVLTPNPPDAVGISKAVADRLSGADFDGDTVMVIPLSGKASITSTKPLEGLEGFEPKDEYRCASTKKDASGKIHYYNQAGLEFKPMTKAGTQMEMGKVSNLITDMTIMGATDSEKARAVRHSMVVIDAYKHKLDYKQSEIDNDIAALRKKYQAHTDEDGITRYGGASTIISRAKSQAREDKYPGQKKIDPETGKLYWDDWKKPETYVDNKGNVKTRQVETTKMAKTEDAMTLVSEAKRPVELMYANYANSMKALANDARKEFVTSGKLQYKPEAAKKYATEVQHLKDQLAVSELNAPRERQAQLRANAAIKVITDENPDLRTKEKKGELKKISQRQLSKARIAENAHRTPITISDSEWEAIQAGAISDHMLSEILKYVDMDQIRERATPKNRKELSQAKIDKIQAMKAAGYTNDEIAKAVGASVSSVLKYSQ